MPAQVEARDTSQMRVRETLPGSRIVPDAVSAPNPISPILDDTTLSERERFLLLEALCVHDSASLVRGLNERRP